jgi:hypothetical protein
MDERRAIQSNVIRRLVHTGQPNHESTRVTNKTEKVISNTIQLVNIKMVKIIYYLPEVH